MIVPEYPEYGRSKYYSNAQTSAWSNGYNVYLVVGRPGFDFLAKPG